MSLSASILATCLRTILSKFDVLALRHSVVLSVDALLLRAEMDLSGVVVDGRRPLIRSIWSKSEFDEEACDFVILVLDLLDDGRRPSFLLLIGAHSRILG